MQNTVHQGSVQNYREKSNRQHAMIRNHTELPRQLRGSNQTQNNEREISLHEENVSQYHSHHQKLPNKKSTNMEEINPQQQTWGILQQSRIMKTQAVQVDKNSENRRQICETSLNRAEHQRPLEEECLRKEPFFINHYYLHLVGQCCCQQHGV